tara:strand:+ start:1473 stop:2681 length:1209 start_codon:yes stop_codon:yes gene_type:complete
MFKNLKKGFFPFLVAFSALSVSGSAAFYSVFGLSKLFAGASTEVIIMAGSLEVAKLVTASLLYQYWDTINKFLKYYLTVATVILVIITSMGIYGFLSAAYQDTFNQLTYVENEKQFLQQKADFYQQDVTRYEKELQQILDNITSLSETRSVSIQIKDTSVVGGVRNTISTVDLRAAQNRLRIEEDKRENVNLKRDVAVDSLRRYQRQILELDNNVEVAGELGPLKYLSGLTGVPMDKIINVLLLIIIFVFDPLAVSLVVAANFAYNQAFPRTRENLYGEEVPVKKNKTFKEIKKDYIKEHGDHWSGERLKQPITEKIEENEERMNIIGQNGNEGLHYEGENVVDTNKDGIITKDEVQNAVNRIKELKRSIEGVTKSSNRVDKALKEIKKLEGDLPDDLTIIY